MKKGQQGRRSSSDSTGSSSSSAETSSSESPSSGTSSSSATHVAIPQRGRAPTAFAADDHGEITIPIPIQPLQRLVDGAPNKRYTRKKAPPVQLPDGNMRQRYEMEFDLPPTGTGVAESGFTFRAVQPLTEEEKAAVFDRLQRQIPERFKPPPGRSHRSEMQQARGVSESNHGDDAGTDDSGSSATTPTPKKEPPKRASFIDPESYYLRITVPAGVCEPTSPRRGKKSEPTRKGRGALRDNILHVVIDRYTPLLSIIETYGARYFPPGGQLVLSHTGELLAGSSYAKQLGLQTAAQMIEKEKKRVREALLLKQKQAAQLHGNRATISVRQATADAMHSFDGLSLEAALLSGPQGRAEETTEAPRDIGESALDVTTGSDLLGSPGAHGDASSESQFLSLCNDLCYVTGVELDEVMERKRLMTARLVARNALVAGLQSLLRWERNREARCPPTYLDVDGLVGQLERDRCLYLRRVVRRQVREDVRALPGVGDMPLESTTSESDSSDDAHNVGAPSIAADLSVGDPSLEERRARRMVAESCKDITSRFRSAAPPPRFLAPSSAPPTFKGPKGFPAESAYAVRRRICALLATEYLPLTFLWGPPEPPCAPPAALSKASSFRSRATSRKEREQQLRGSKKRGGALLGSRDLAEFFDGMEAAASPPRNPQSHSDTVSKELAAHSAAHRSLLERVYKQLHGFPLENAEGGMTQQFSPSDGLAHDATAKSIDAILAGPYAPVATGRDGRRLPGSGYGVDLQVDGFVL